MKRRNPTPQQRTVLRATAALLSLLMLLSVVAVMPVSAADTVADYTVDFKQLYQDMGLTADYDVKANGEDIAYVDAINVSGNSAVLTQNGLKTGIKNAASAGVIIQTPTTGDFVIEIEVALDFSTANEIFDSENDRWPYTIEFGYNYSTTSNGFSSYYGNVGWKSNKTLSFTRFSNKFSNNEAAMYDRMLTDNEVCNYAIYVQSGKVVRFTISCGDAFVTNTVYSGNANDGCFLAENGGFAFRTRNFSNYSGAATFNFTKVSVTSTEASTLDANRTVPTSSATNYQDTANVNYTVGTVLHNMDFSEVENFSDTGYFVTKDNSKEVFANIVGDNLLFTTNNYWTWFAITGNNIPQTMKDYTVSFRFHFLTTSSVGRIQLQHGTGLKSTGKYENLNYINEIYQNGKFDGTTSANEMANKARISAGEWVTVTSSYANGFLDEVIFTYDDGTTERFDLREKNYPAGKVFIIRFAKTQMVEFSNVQIVAGSYADQQASDKGLLFPEEDNALVQTVKSPVVAKYVQLAEKENEKVDVRIVGLVNFESLKAFAKVGYKLSITKDGQQVVTDYDISGKGVYNSIKAGDDTYVAGEGDFADCEYIYGLELRNFDTTGTYEVTLTAFAEKENGARIYDYNGAVSFKLVDGQVPA